MIALSLPDKGEEKEIPETVGIGSNKDLVNAQILYQVKSEAITSFAINQVSIIMTDII
jgi:hypothetical protein